MTTAVESDVAFIKSVGGKFILQQLPLDITAKNPHKYESLLPF